MAQHYNATLNDTLIAEHRKLLATSHTQYTTLTAGALEVRTRALHADGYSLMLHGVLACLV